MQQPEEKHFIWLDLEMTGLKAHDTIIEIATVITDPQLNIIAEGPNLAIHQSNATLEAMDAWCQKTHAESGLIERIKKSSLTTQEAEMQTLTFLSEHMPANTAPLCGNSICTDRWFLIKDMPKLAAFFHYRQIDVTSLKILMNHWTTHPMMPKKNTHRALDDVYESIAELKDIRTKLFK